MPTDDPNNATTTSDRLPQIEDENPPTPPPVFRREAGDVVTAPADRPDGSGALRTYEVRRVRTDGGDKSPFHQSFDTVRAVSPEAAKGEWRAKYSRTVADVPDSDLSAVLAFDEAKTARDGTVIRPTDDPAYPPVDYMVGLAVDRYGSVLSVDLDDEGDEQSWLDEISDAIASDLADDEDDRILSSGPIDVYIARTRLPRPRPRTMQREVLRREGNPPLLTITAT